MQKNFLKELLRTDQTVFSFKELIVRFRTSNVKALASKLNYYVKHGDLHRIRRGLYAKDINYDRLELATKILSPSYISFETVLTRAGIVFQYYSQIFVASYQSRDIICDDQTYSFRTVKATILVNAAGIELRKNYSIATPERAFLDIVYRTKEYHFDNLNPLNWDTVYKLLPIYGDNKKMRKRVDMYYKAFKDNIL